MRLITLRPLLTYSIDSYRNFSIVSSWHIKNFSELLPTYTYFANENTPFVTILQETTLVSFTLLSALHD